MDDKVIVIGEPDTAMMNALKENSKEMDIAGDVPVLSGITYQSIGTEKPESEISIDEGIKMINDITKPKDNIFEQSADNLEGFGTPDSFFNDKW